MYLYTGKGRAWEKHMYLIKSVVEQGPMGSNRGSCAWAFRDVHTLRDSCCAVRGLLKVSVLRPAVRQPRRECLAVALMRDAMSSVLNVGAGTVLCTYSNVVREYQLPQPDVSESWIRQSGCRVPC